MSPVHVLHDAASASQRHTTSGAALVGALDLDDVVRHRPEPTDPATRARAPRARRACPRPRPRSRPPRAASTRRAAPRPPTAGARRAPPSPSWPAARAAPRPRAGAPARSPRPAATSRGTTFHTSPISLAAAASTRSPVSSSSIAFDQPMRPGRRIAPTIVGTPSPTSGKPNSASSAAITKSHREHRGQPVAEAVAGDRRDRRLPELEPALERVDRRDLPERARPLPHRAAPVLQVGADAERAAGAGDDARPTRPRRRGTAPTSR